MENGETKNGNGGAKMGNGETKNGNGGAKMKKGDTGMGNGDKEMERGDANAGYERESYDRLVGALRSFHRQPPNPELLAAKTMSRISDEGRTVESPITLAGILFGWTSVAWVRRSMMAASIAIVSLFIYQQYQIMSGLRELESKLSEGVITTERRITTSGNEYLTKIMLRERFSENDSISVSMSDIEDLIESYKELQISYERINRFLRMNPQFVRRLENEYGESFSSVRGKPKI